MREILHDIKHVKRTVKRIKTNADLAKIRQEMQSLLLLLNEIEGKIKSEYFDEDKQQWKL